MSDMLINIGCFRCGEESVKDMDNTFNKVSCQLCGNENNMSELLLDKIHYLNEKIEKLQESNRILKEALEKISETDITDRPPDMPWLTKWRNNTKERAREALKKVGEV